jgi:hypothetical protein
MVVLLTVVEAAPCGGLQATGGRLQLQGRSGGRRQPSFLAREECASAQEEVGEAVAGTRSPGARPTNGGPRTVRGNDADRQRPRRVRPDPSTRSPHHRHQAATARAPTRAGSHFVRSRTREGVDCIWEGERACAAENIALIDAPRRFAGVNRTERIKTARLTRSAFDFDSLGPGSPPTPVPRRAAWPYLPDVAAHMRQTWLLLSFRSFLIGVVNCVNVAWMRWREAGQSIRLMAMRQ